MPGTARRFGVVDDVLRGVAGVSDARYLRWLLDRYRGDAALALAGYNAGEGAVDRRGGVPPYRGTRNFVKIVQSNHRLLQGRVAERVAEGAR
ncbi:MAG: lytic transglycosylase domain-containing protein [Albidovulum sp.]